MRIHEITGRVTERHVGSTTSAEFRIFRGADGHVAYQAWAQPNAVLRTVEPAIAALSVAADDYIDELIAPTPAPSSLTRQAAEQLAPHINPSHGMPGGITTADDVLDAARRAGWAVED